MKAVVLENYGGTEELQIREIPNPLPGREELLIKVHATALNRADILQRKGLYPGPPSEHEIPGLEFSGVVQALGSDVMNYAIGDRVMGIVASGAYAEHLTIHHQQAMLIPENLSYADAAAIPEAWLTAYDALLDKGKLTKGQTCLIHAGASGVGTAAIQIAESFGSQIAITASASKLDTCISLGADLAIDYNQEDFVESTQTWTDGKGINLIIDLVGGEYLQRNVRAIASKGTIVQVGLMGSGKPELDLGTLLRKRVTLVGTVLRTRSLSEKVELTKEFCQSILPNFQTQFSPNIDSIYSFDAIAEAHTRMENNLNTGKIIIQIQ